VRAVGLDFSPETVRHAREFAGDAVEYVCADVYDYGVAATKPA
jgi:hypothetical protein